MNPLKKFIYYFFCFEFGLLTLLGVLAILLGDISGLGLILFGLLGIWVCRKLFLPISFEEALGKARKNLINPMEIATFSEEFDTTIKEVNRKISTGEISAYEYSGYLFIENELKESAQQR